MGAVTEALAGDRVGGGRGAALRRRGDRDRHRRRRAEVRWDGGVACGAARARQRRARRAGAAAGRAGARRPGARGRAAQAQHAARAAAAAARPARRPARGVRRARSTSTSPPRSSRRRTPQARRGRVPALAPCEIYCHSLTDPSILGPSCARAGAQTLTCFGLHMPARLFRGDPERREGARRSTATLRSLDSVLAEPIEDCLWRTPSRRAVPGGAHAARARGRAGLPGGNIFHRDLAWPFAEDEAEVGTLGRRDRAPARAALRRGRAPRRRRQRHPGPQRGDGRAHDGAENLTLTLGSSSMADRTSDRRADAAARRRRRARALQVVGALVHEPRACCSRRSTRAR